MVQWFLVVLNLFTSRGVPTSMGSPFSFSEENSGVQKYTHTFENEMNVPGILENMTTPDALHLLRKNLRTWYLSNARDLPWRLEPSVYGTWVSEIMLQQTRVETGIPKWHAFLDKFPDVEALANATEDEVMKAWEGLGYYRRARFLHKAAQEVARRGKFPQTASEWQALPGIGTYTSAAIASIALGEPVAAVDGNVQRVISRVFGVFDPVDATAGAQQIQEWANRWLDHKHPGDHNQAVMELGATVCTPQQPSCHACPIASRCHAAHDPAIWGILPAKTPKKAPTLWAMTLHFAMHESHWVVVQRPARGVWAKLWSLPECSPTNPGFVRLDEILPPIRHMLTHRTIEAKIIGWQAPSEKALRAWAQDIEGRVIAWPETADLAFPRMLTKVFADLQRNVGTPPTW
jgi:A/G-specific adenine glycosylase